MVYLVSGTGSFLRAESVEFQTLTVSAYMICHPMTAKAFVCPDDPAAVLKNAFIWQPRNTENHILKYS